MEFNNLEHDPIQDDMLDRLRLCMLEGSNTEVVTNEILREFRVSEIEHVIRHLVYVFKAAPQLLPVFWQRSSDACPLECTNAEIEEKAFNNWVRQTISYPKK